MKLLVTGATGFLGRAVVRAAAAAGHDVIAMIRPAAALDPADWPPGTVFIRGDLRQPGSWCSALAEVEAVVHLAAALAGDFAAQFSSTVIATENLLDCLPMRTIRRFVHISSFSVYDYGALRNGEILTESSHIEPRPRERRDAYTTTKIIQERLVTSACRAGGTPYVVLRPGAVYGPGHDWDCGRAMRFGRFDLIFAPMGAFKGVYVENCADAIVKAIDALLPSESVLNIIDDVVPSHRRYHRLCRRAGAQTGIPIYVPWALLSTLGWIIALFNRMLFKNRAKLPNFLSHSKQKASWKPLRYSNAAARRQLGWTSRVPLAEAVSRTVGGGSQRTAD